MLSGVQVLHWLPGTCKIWNSSYSQATVQMLDQKQQMVAQKLLALTLEEVKEPNWTHPPTEKQKMELKQVSAKRPFSLCVAPDLPYYVVLEAPSAPSGLSFVGVRSLSN